jgi:hypothetical protein
MSHIQIMELVQWFLISANFLGMSLVLWHGN